MFLSCGDSLFDLFAAQGGDIAEVSLAGRVGGAPLNVALGLARLGHPVGFFSKVSSDLFGRQIRGFMAREGIDQQFLIATERNTTLAIVSLDAAGVPTYSFVLEGTADRSIEPGEVPRSLPDAVEVIHFTSYSTVTEPTASSLLQLARQEAGRRIISYDPNIRASVEPDLDRWRQKVSEMVPLATLVKASDEDLALLYPGRAVESVLADWLASGVALAVVTRGAEGATAVTASGRSASARGHAVSVVDTVGAGDTFQAALFAGLKESGRMSRDGIATIDEAGLAGLLDFAVRAAAVTCGRRGADLPTRADLGLPPLPTA
ncbi:carbohydrate kinase family protein [Mangrovibrevibacter kandeliae]|uniref:carbohydrate kinase family protein n=1 Tax=Mangrovibrevibacter kandeliae TaxID=2968473 RepID=UPI002118D5F5|nr:carbohydrate kinase [Aurantimonas sp. CSK15Z-1]MCQ8780847.1 carbohydrate kinase [Aurantimonas sp. CSK15Z-1]